MNSKRSCAHNIESKISGKQITKAAAAKLPYRQLIGSLAYLMIGTRPDLAQPLSVLSQFLVNPGRVHYEAALRALAYVKATATVGLLYTSEASDTLPKIVGMSDASWATHEDSMTSQAGYFFNMCGAAVSWRSYKIKRVCHSSTEAEYVTCNDASRKAEYHVNVLGELGLSGEGECGKNLYRFEGFRGPR